MLKVLVMKENSSTDHCGRQAFGEIKYGGGHEIWSQCSASIGFIVRVLYLQ